LNNPESKKEVLIRISQFIVRKESAALTKDCHDGLVKTVLFAVGNTGLSIPKMTNEIEKQMGVKKFPASIIQSSVGRLCDEKKELLEKSGKYFLENEEYEKMKETITERRHTLDHIESIIKAKMQKELKKAKVDAKALGVALEVFYEFLVTWFSSESSFVANLLLHKKKFTAPDFPAHILGKTLQRVTDDNLRQAIQHSIFELFEAPKETLVRFLYGVLQNYLHLELLNIDPECRILQKVAFSKKTLILDTNILLSFFLESHPKHEGTAEILSISQELGVNLVFTKMTKQEWLAHLEGAHEEFRTIRSTRPSLLRKLEDVFITSYFKEKAVTPSLTWQGFYLQMRQIENLAKAKRIGFWYKKELSLDSLSNKEFFDPVSGRVYYCAKIVGNPKGKKVCQHDAYNLLLVRKIREDYPSDILGPSCWFLTHDSSLLCADEGLNEFLKDQFAPPSSFLADMWITIIAPFLGAEISASTLAETFVHLMKTNFATMPSGLNAQKTVEVLGHWLPYKALTDTEIEAILGDALVTRYYDELRKALALNPRKVKEIRERLHKEADERVYGIFDERVASAQTERDEAQKLALKREQELLAERRQRKLILRFCAFLGVIFAVSGLVFFATGNLTTGSALTVSGIAFIVLALAFRYFKMKIGIFEIEAKQ